MPEGGIDSLFERFTQADTSTTREYEGTGLGLAICKQLGTLMDGDIGAKNRPSGGAEFWIKITLPIVDPASPELSPIKSVEPIAGSNNAYAGKRVLVVEDHPVNQQVIGSMLKKIGVKSHLAECGVDALEMIQDEHYDLVLMDLQMPEMDGFETTKAIRDLDDKQLSEIHIIALTGNVMGDIREQCSAVGMIDFIVKPVSLSNLRKVIAEHLG